MGEEGGICEQYNGSVGFLLENYVSIQYSIRNAFYINALERETDFINPASVLFILPLLRYLKS